MKNESANELLGYAILVTSCSDMSDESSVAYEPT